MVDNRGISPVSSFSFKSGDASGMANKMSDEKNGQGGEYFAQEMQEEETPEQQEYFQDRSAQLRASLNGLAIANVGSIHFMKAVKEKQEELKKKQKIDEKSEFEDFSEFADFEEFEEFEELFDE